MRINLLVGFYYCCLCSSFAQSNGNENNSYHSLEWVKDLTNYQVNISQLKNHYYQMTKMNLDPNSLVTSNENMYTKVKAAVMSSGNSLGLTQSIANGEYSSIVVYDNFKARTHRNYTLNVNVLDNRVTKINFDGGGASVHTGGNSSGYVFYGGELFYTYDSFGEQTSGETLIKIATKTSDYFYTITISLK